MSKSTTGYSGTMAESFKRTLIGLVMIGLIVILLIWLDSRDSRLFGTEGFFPLFAFFYLPGSFFGGIWVAVACLLSGLQLFALCWSTVKSSSLRKHPMLSILGVSIVHPAATYLENFIASLLLP